MYCKQLWEKIGFYRPTLNNLKVGCLYSDKETCSIEVVYYNIGGVILLKF